MITDIRIIAARVSGDEAEEIEIVAEISERHVPFGEEGRTKLVSGFFQGFELFKDEIQSFSDNKNEVRKAWEVLRDAIHSKFPERTNEAAKKMRRLQDIGADLKCLK